MRKTVQKTLYKPCFFSFAFPLSSSFFFFFPLFVYWVQRDNSSVSAGFLFYAHLKSELHLYFVVIWGFWFFGGGRERNFAAPLGEVFLIVFYDMGLFWNGYERLDDDWKGKIALTCCSCRVICTHDWLGGKYEQRTLSSCVRVSVYLFFYLYIQYFSCTGSAWNLCCQRRYLRS